MKFKIASAFLLLVSFCWLGILSGTIPVLAESSESHTDEGTIQTPPVSPSPSVDSSSGEECFFKSAAPEPESIPSSSPEPVLLSEPVPTAEPPSVTILPATLTSDSLIDNGTSYDIDAEALLSEGLSLSLPKDGYQILIIHTHATEAYTQDGTDVYEASDEYRTTDTNYSVVQVGRELAMALSAYGLNVLHDESLHDYPSYNGSYVRSGEAIEEYLSAYPGICIVIDLHRDAIGDDNTIYKTVTTAEGTQAAQIMFVMGTDINLEHPDWRENLKLALTLQTTANGRYASLMRPTVLCSYRYNQQLSPGSLLMEVGTAGNTLEESVTAVKLFADAVGPLLASYIEA